MNKNYLIIVPLLAFVSILCIASGPSLAATDAGPETMKLEAPAGKKPSQFPHKTHQESFACKDCHHAKTDGGVKSPYAEGMEVKKCITCHNKDDMSNPQLNSFKLAAHGLCKECHKQNKDSAPTKCSGCHIK